MADPRWGAWLKNQRRDMELCARVLGIQDIDIRRIRYAWNYDMVEVETWNRRRLRVSGLEMYMSVRLTEILARVRTAPLAPAFVELVVQPVRLS